MPASHHYNFFSDPTSIWEVNSLPHCCLKLLLLASQKILDQTIDASKEVFDNMTKVSAQKTKETAAIVTNGCTIIINLTKVLTAISRAEVMSIEQKQKLDSFLEKISGSDKWIYTWLVSEIERYTQEKAKIPTIDVMKKMVPQACLEFLNAIIPLRLLFSRRTVNAFIESAVPEHEKEAQQEHVINTQSQIIELTSIFDTFTSKTKELCSGQVVRLKLFCGQFETGEGVVNKPFKLLEDILELKPPVELAGPDAPGLGL